MNYIYTLLAKVCRSMQASEPCKQVQTFHVGDDKDLLSNNLNTNTPESILFNRKWEETKGVGFRLPLLLLYPVEKQAPRQLLKGESGHVTLNITCVMADKMANDCDGASDNCKQRSKEQVLADTETMLQQVWQEFFHQADNDWSNDPSNTPKLNVVGDISWNNDRNFNFSPLGLGGTFMSFKVMYSGCFTKGVFVAQSAPENLTLNAGCCD